MILVLGTNKLLIIPNNDKIYKSEGKTDLLKFKFNNPIDQQFITEHFTPTFFSNTPLDQLESEPTGKLDMFEEFKYKSTVTNTQEVEGSVLDFDMILVNLSNIENKLNQDYEIRVIYDIQEKQLPNLMIRTGKVII